LEAFVADWYASVYLGVRVDYRARLLPRGGIEDVGSLDELDFFPLSSVRGSFLYLFIIFIYCGARGVRVGGVEVLPPRGALLGGFGGNFEGGCLDGAVDTFLRFALARSGGWGWRSFV